MPGRTFQITIYFLKLTLSRIQQAFKPNLSLLSGTDRRIVVDCFTVGRKQYRAPWPSLPRCAVHTPIGQRPPQVRFLSVVSVVKHLMPQLIVAGSNDYVLFSAFGDVDYCCRRQASELSPTDALTRRFVHKYSGYCTDRTPIEPNRRLPGLSFVG